MIEILQAVDCPYHGKTETTSKRCPHCRIVEIGVFTRWNQTYEAAIKGSIRTMSPEKAVIAAIAAANVAAKIELEAALRRAGHTMDASLCLGEKPHYEWLGSTRPRSADGAMIDEFDAGKRTIR